MFQRHLRSSWESFWGTERLSNLSQVRQQVWVAEAELGLGIQYTPVCTPLLIFSQSMGVSEIWRILPLTLSLVQTWRYPADSVCIGLMYLHYHTCEHTHIYMPQLQLCIPYAPSLHAVGICVSISGTQDSSYELSSILLPSPRLNPLSRSGVLASKRANLTRSCLPCSQLKEVCF